MANSAVLVPPAALWIPICRSGFAERYSAPGRPRRTAPATNINFTWKRVNYLATVRSRQKALPAVAGPASLIPGGHGRAEGGLDRAPCGCEGDPILQKAEARARDTREFYLFLGGDTSLGRRVLEKRRMRNWAGCKCEGRAKSVANTAKAQAPVGNSPLGSRIDVRESPRAPKCR